jgi:hypothetical protein
MKAPVGRVYVLSNEAMPGLLKIGYTMNTVEGRVRELSSATGVPSEFFIEYQVECRDAAGVEALVHESFSNFRHNNSREFFSISLADAVNEIRKHAREIIDEEVAGSIRSGTIGGDNCATFYLIRVNNSKNMFRVGLVKERRDFLGTDEFRSMVIDLYGRFDSSLVCGCEVIQAAEFAGLNEESLEKMGDILDENIKRLKLLNMGLLDTNGYRRAREYHPRLNGKFDLRTLSFSEYKDTFPAAIYNSSLSLLEPIAKACLVGPIGLANNSGVSSNANIENLSRLDAIKKMGI